MSSHAHDVDEDEEDDVGDEEDVDDKGISYDDPQCRARRGW